MPNCIFQHQLCQINTGNKLESSKTMILDSKCWEKHLGGGKGLCLRGGSEELGWERRSLGWVLPKVHQLIKSGKHLHSIPVYTREERQVEKLPLLKFMATDSAQFTTYHHGYWSLMLSRNLEKSVSDQGGFVEAVCIKTWLWNLKFWLCLHIASLYDLGKWDKFRAK